MINITFKKKSKQKRNMETGNCKRVSTHIHTHVLLL